MVDGLVSQTVELSLVEVNLSVLTRPHHVVALHVLCTKNETERERERPTERGRGETRGRQRDTDTEGNRESRQRERGKE